MDKRLNLGNSIYQEKGSLGRSGLAVSGGMLINNRPIGETGISQMTKLRSDIRRAEKIATMSTAFAISGSISKGVGDCGI